MAVDLMSDVFRLIRLTGALMFRFDLSGRWYIRNAATEAAEMAKLLPAGTDQVIIFHIVNGGECWMRHPPGGWEHVGAGDAVLLAHGHAHEMANLTEASPVPFRNVLGEQSLFDLRSLRYERGAAPKVEIVCGFLGCSRRAFAPLCASLPAFCRVALGASARSLVDYAVSETMDERPGADTLRLRMAELLFMEALRHHVAELPAGATGWLAGLRDPLVARAMQSLHEAPCKPWSVNSLAAATHSSRSSLAARFREVMGEPPMRYLRRLRMQRAASYLSEYAYTVERVADEVGYQSSAAFQRAFKRCFGVPPATWRRSLAGAPTAAPPPLA